MATTNGRLAAAVVQALLRSGGDFAILHGADRIRAENVTGDVDLVTARPASDVIAQAWTELENTGLLPILYWPNDLGLTASVFLATGDGREGVQIDLLHDPRGHGKYGVLSHRLLAYREWSDGLPILQGPAEISYLLAKGIVKADASRLSTLIEQVGAEERAVIGETAQVVLVPACPNQSSATYAPDKYLAFPTAEVEQAPHQNYLARPPTAALVHLNRSEEAVARALRERFGSYLPTTSDGRAGGLRWLATRVWPSRVRAGLYVSWGELRTAVRPDLSTDEESVDGAAVAITRAMTGRLRGQKPVRK